MVLLSLKGMDPTIRDSQTYQNRNNLYVSNANLFVANNNNPFLISPYSPPANLAKQSQITNINQIISSINSNLSSVINFVDYTLKISTITNTSYSDTVLISTNNINIEGSDVNISGDVSFPDNTFFNNISTGFIFASIANLSSVNISSLIVNNETVNNLTVNSSLTASSISGNYLEINQISTGYVFASLAEISSLKTSTITTDSLTVSSISGKYLEIDQISTGYVFASIAEISSLKTSTITTDSLTVSSTLTASTINTTNINFETLTGSSITSNFMTINSTLNVSSVSASSVYTNILQFSSLCMIPSTISTFTGPATSSILICLNGSYWKIPIEPA